MKSIAALWAFAAFAAASVVAEAPAAASGARVELSIAPGPEWAHVKWFGPVRMVLTPQIAVWLEDSSGRYAADLYITEKAGKSAWGSVRRPEALPVWSHARGRRYADGLYMPTKDEPLPDAVSGPTPKPKKGDVEVLMTLTLPVEAGSGSRLMVEVNSSFDFNAAYPERKGNVNGQPSIVYVVEFGSAESDYSSAAIIGTGHPAGADGAIVPGTAGLDSALRIVEKIRVRVLR
jgi:hypothetical protein